MSDAPAARPVVGALIRLVAAGSIACMFALVKLASLRGVHVAESIFYRQAAAIPLMLALAARTGGIGRLKTQRPMAHGLRMLLGVSGMALNFIGMIMLPLADATIIGFSVPLFATLLAAVLLREPTGPWRWGALLIGLVGVLLVVGPLAFEGRSFAQWGAVIALAGALVTALVTIQVRSLARTEASVTIVFWFTLTSLLPLGLVMLWHARWHPPDVWGLIALMALAGVLAQWALTESLRLAPVAVVMPMDYTTLLWATLFGWLLFAEQPSAQALVGGPLIIVSGLVILWRERVRSLARPTVVIE